MKLYFRFLPCVIFIMPSIFALTFQSLVKNMIAENITSYTSDKLSMFAHFREVAIEDMFNVLPKKLSYTCDINDIDILRDPKYYTQYIRVLGLITKDTNCSSSVGGLSSIELNNIIKYHDNGYYLLPTPSGGSEYMVALKSEKGLFYAILNNAWIEPMLSTICEKCFTVSMRSHIDRSYVSIKKGSGLVNTLIDDGSQSGKRFDIHVFATQSLLDNISSWYDKYVYMISFMLGGLIVFMFTMSARRPVSHKKSIKRALRLHEFIPYYQPVVDSSNNMIVGVEVLARWQLPDGSIIPPSSFIYDVESDPNMLLGLTIQLIEQVCKDKQEIEHMQGLWFSINIGATHFLSESLLDYMKSIKGVSHGISFEITERQPLHNLLDAAKYVDELRSLGHEIKIDDFGVGYGGFSYLQAINVDSIKIDKMFIDTIGTMDMKRNVLDSIISMSQDNSYEVIAEGVETKTQINYLKDRGVKMIQGYYYSPPVPFYVFKTLVKNGF